MRRTHKIIVMFGGVVLSVCSAALAWEGPTIDQPPRELLRGYNLSGVDASDPESLRVVLLTYVVACDCRNPEECHPELAPPGEFPPVVCVGPCPNPADVCELISTDTNGDGLFDQYECQCGPPGGFCNPQCPTDILEFDGSGFNQEIDPWELANLLGCWSDPGPPSPCAPLVGVCTCFDFNGDGCISAIDLAGSVLGEWGACCTDNRCIEGESCDDCGLSDSGFPNECTSETWCADAVDNDCDGLIDCDDPDCTGDANCP